MLITLAQELGKAPNKLSPEGPTDSTPHAPTATDSNWELSAESRQCCPSGGACQRMSGPDHAGAGLRRPVAVQTCRPLESANRRILLIVQWVIKNEDADAKPG